DGNLAATLQAGVGKFRERLVEEEADMRRRDFVGRNIIAQLGIALRMMRVPRQVFSRELALNEFRIFGEEKDASLQAHGIGAFGDRTGQQRTIHRQHSSAEKARNLRPGFSLGRWSSLLKLRAPQRTSYAGWPTGCQISVTTWRRGRPS